MKICSNCVIPETAETLSFSKNDKCSVCVQINQKKNINLSVSENLGKNGFYLPLGAHINNKKQEFIVNKLLNHLN